MHDEAQPENTPSTKPAWRRFSLREILLITAAVAAIAALFAKNQTPQTTDFARNFDAKALLTQVLKRQGLKDRLTGGGGSGGGDASLSLQVSYELRGIDSQTVRQKVMPQLHKAVQERLAEEGVQIFGTSRSGSNTDANGNYKEMTAFSFRYRGKSIGGAFKANLVYGETGRPRVMMTLDEW